MSDQQSLMDELEEAVQSGSREKRIDTLRRITDLFLMAPAQLSNEQIGVFDDVLAHLVTRVRPRRAPNWQTGLHRSRRRRTTSSGNLPTTTRSQWPVQC